jgi:hypothetical protein
MIKCKCGLVKDDNQELFPKHGTLCKLCNRIRLNEYYVKNKERIATRKKIKYRIDGVKSLYLTPEQKERKKQSCNTAKRKRRVKDPQYATRENIRGSINLGFRKRGFKKKTRTLDILGCSFEFFMQYIESKFESWMSWDNRGKFNGTENYGWDLDHVIPISTAVTEEDVIKLNHYSNFQPLCSYTNRVIKKNN